MRDVETHTEDYLSLCPEAKRLSDQYKPSDVLDEMMVGLGNRWTQCVEALTKRYYMVLKFRFLRKFEFYQS